MSESKLGYVSLFSSAGLGCYGFKKNNFECAATAELIPRRLAVQRANHIADENDGYILGDLTDPSIRKQLITKVSDWEKRNSSEITVVIATPPCQGMSVANHKKKDELGRNSLVVESIKIIYELKPKYFVMENVRAFLTSACKDTDDEIKTIKEAINNHLLSEYNIYSKVVNFKEYGANSSRTRTLVIGVRRDIQDLTPLDLFPERHEAPTLRELIYNLPRLTKMGEIDPNDIYHSFRPYNPAMRPWIHDLKPGENAFDNTNPSKRPHRVIDGVLVPNKESNGDKYRRNLWDKVAPCVHTRNDILASQSTIHPEDDRVFSIRELSRMMGVPDDFRWTPEDPDTLNSLPFEEKKDFLKENEINIRQCLGEGVPTQIFSAIAKKIKQFDRKSRKQRGRPLKSYDNPTIPDIARFIFESENKNPNKINYSAYYTRQDIVFSLLSALPDFNHKKILRVLEPSVGAGSFLPILLTKYQGKELHIDVVDIDEAALNQTRSLLKSLNLDTNIHIKYIHKDFLKTDINQNYDLIIGNPPFGKKTQSRERYHTSFGIKDTSSLFLEKCLPLTEYTAFIIPKTFLSGGEYQSFRNWISENYHIREIQDYGESAFYDIKIETIGIILSRKSKTNDTVINSIPLSTRHILPQKYITDTTFPTWLIYRNNFFDQMTKEMELNLFSVYRDRSLTKTKQSNIGETRVVKARNINHGKIIQNGPILYCREEDIPKQFKYIRENNDTLILVPNLSYYPRGAVMPNHTYADGSAAVLIPNTELSNVQTVLEFWESSDFFIYYRIARNYSVRSLNIDKSSVFYWGIPKNRHKELLQGITPSSKNLYLDISQW